jgi:hypothetical protein
MKATTADQTGLPNSGSGSLTGFQASKPHAPHSPLAIAIRAALLCGVSAALPNQALALPCAPNLFQDHSGNGVLTGNCTNTGDMDIFSLFFNPSLTVTKGATLTNLDTTGTQGRINLQNAGLSIEAGGTLNNTTTLAHSFLGAMINADQGVINNAGVINNNAGAQIITGNVLGSFTNSGTVNNAGSIVQTKSQMFFNSGAFNNSSYFTNRTDSFAINIGTVNNSGRLLNMASYFRNDATINNTGELTSAIGGPLSASYRSRFINVAGATLNNTGAGVVNNQFGSTLTNSGVIANDSRLNNTGALNNSGRINNAGVVNNGSAGSLNNNGSIANSAGGSLINSGGATLTNSGAIDNDSNFSNSGTLVIEANGRLSNTGGGYGGFYGSFQQTGGTAIIDGRLQQATVNFSGGSLLGSGSLQAQNGPVQIGADVLVDPGRAASTGTLSITGDANFNGKLHVDLQSSQQFDKLKVDGLANLMAGSALEVAILGNFLPSLGSTFDIFSGGHINGIFDNLLLPTVSGVTFSLSYLTSNGADVARLTAIAAPVQAPLPAAFYLFGAGFAGLASMGRRRAAKSRC